MTIIKKPATDKRQVLFLEALLSAGHCALRETTNSRSSATPWNFPEEALELCQL